MMRRRCLSKNLSPRERKNMKRRFFRRMKCAANRREVSAVERLAQLVTSRGIEKARREDCEKRTEEVRERQRITDLALLRQRQSPSDRKEGRMVALNLVPVNPPRYAYIGYRLHIETLITMIISKLQVIY
jgi:hypothetical protein